MRQWLHPSRVNVSESSFAIAKLALCEQNISSPKTLPVIVGNP